MIPVAIVAIGAESALGSGVRAYSVGEVGGVPVTAIARDPALEHAGLGRPFLARAAREPSSVNPAAALLGRAAAALVRDLERVLPDFRSRRVALAVGTSSGGMAPLVAALDARARGEPVLGDLARGAPYFGPLAALDGIFGVPFVARARILAACASSAMAIGLAARWLELGYADVVIAGGYDAVTPFVATGFESLGATSRTRPAPFRAARDGMALGEAAVLCALTRPGASGAALGHVVGFGASSDAVHVTAPDREGRGLALAAARALADAGIDGTGVDLVSAHATATPFNDAAEWKALETVLGSHAREVVVHPFKSVVGHTLGASAALELAAALDAMNRAILPAACSAGDTDPDLLPRLLAVNESGAASTCLKLSAAFGGANAAIVATTKETSGHALVRSAVALEAVGQSRTAEDALSLRGKTRLPDAQLTRLDALSAAAVAAVAAVLEGRDVPADRTGVVVGTVSACLESNELFQSGLRGRGAAGAAPRRFPATSPNLVAGQCSITFGLRGPSLSVGADGAAALEALVVAHDLLAAGDADALLVVAAEDVGDAVRDLFHAAGFPVPAAGAVAALLVRRPGGTGLSRDLLLGPLHEARAGGGSLRELPPGPPTFLEAIRRIQTEMAP